MEPSARKKKPPFLVQLLGGAAILGALYVILFSGTPNFSSEDAEHILADLASHYSEEATRRGSEAKLQYSNVEIHGLAYDKWAHVNNLAVDFIYQQWQEHTRFSFSTQSAELFPDHANPARISLRFSDAVNVISGSDLLAMVQPLQPIIYSFNRKPADMEGAIRHRVTMPGNLDVTLLNPKRTIHVELATPAQMEADFFETQHRLHARALSGTMQIRTEDSTWRVENADIRYDSLQKGPAITESKGTATLDKILYSRADARTSPFVATGAWSLREQRNISGSVESMILAIDHGLLTNGDSKLSINGDVNFDIDDTAYGELVVEISNPQQFVESGWIAKGKEQEALALLDEIVGEKIGGHKQAIINISRIKNGTWKIGKLMLNDDLRHRINTLFIFNTQETHDQNNGEKTDPS